MRKGVVYVIVMMCVYHVLGDIIMMVVHVLRTACFHVSNVSIAHRYALNVMQAIYYYHNITPANQIYRATTPLLNNAKSAL